jgi:diadenosine tetraphosphate (Ap4A) HIT family hydrolase
MSAPPPARPDDCVLCRIVARGSEDVLVSGGAWVAASLPGLSQPGALAVIARRHAEGLGELTPGELAMLGPFLGRVSRALQASCGAPKVYLFSFGERHGHFHVGMVARPENLEPERRGPALILSHLGQGPPPPELDRSAPEILADVRRRLGASGGATLASKR